MSPDRRVPFLDGKRERRLAFVDFLDDADSSAGFQMYDGKVPIAVASGWKSYNCSPISGLEVTSKFQFTEDEVVLRWRTKGDAPRGAIWLKVVCDDTEIAPRHFELGPPVDDWQSTTIPADHLRFALLHSPWAVDFLFQSFEE